MGATAVPGACCTLLCEPSGRILEVVEDGAALTSTTARAFGELFEEGSRRKALDLLRRAAQVGVVIGWELQAPSRDGDPRVFRFAAARLPEGVMACGTCAPEAHETGRGNLLESMARLTSEMTATQRDLVQANRELSRVVGERNELAGMVAHDLRGALHSVALSTQALAASREGRVDDRDGRMLRRIASATDMMSKLVTDMLDLSAIETGRLRLRVEQRELDQLVEEVVELHRPQANLSSVEIDLRVSERPLLAHVDPTKLQQVVTNLLGNAIRHSPPHGRIEVRVSRRDDDALIEVEDHGPGIPASARATIFRPFETGPSPGHPGSTGLGLAIVDRIVSGHGGKTEVESELGSGSTFRVRVPVRPPPA